MSMIKRYLDDEIEFCEEVLSKENIKISLEDLTNLICNCKNWILFNDTDKIDYLLDNII